MKTLHDKTVAITGAASGIGRALALQCASLGARLAIVDIDEEGLAQTADAARARGATVYSQRLDVADRAAIYRWAEQVERQLGGADVLVNNAGSRCRTRSSACATKISNGSSTSISGAW